MLFNSYSFLFLFLPINIFLFYFLSKTQNSKLLVIYLLIASLIFYSIDNIQYLPLLIISVFINYLFGQIIKKNKNFKRKLYLIISIIFNLFLLIFFKYSSFLILDILNFNELSADKIYFYQGQIPLGISIYTFTQIGFLVDTYLKETYDSNFYKYSLFVILFPHILAGPIIHHKKIITQLEGESFYKFKLDNLVYGIILFVIGLSKKVLIGDNIGPYADTMFDDPALFGVIGSWIGSLAYTFQLYFDFSGYSDMAIGLAIMTNIKLPINFNSPYKSVSLIDFWKRWHITLSTFLKDYLYIPLGGNRFGSFRRYQNIFITMILGGIWHGANFTFIIWGFIHGIGIIANHLTKQYFKRLPNFISIFITFLFVNFAWVIFRANSISDAIVIYRNMFDLNNINYDEINIGIVYIIICMFIVFILPNSQEILKLIKKNTINVSIISFLFFLNIISINLYSPFIYFAF